MKYFQTTVAFFCIFTLTSTSYASIQQQNIKLVFNVQKKIFTNRNWRIKTLQTYFTNPLYYNSKKITLKQFQQHFVKNFSQYDFITIIRHNVSANLHQVTFTAQLLMTNPNHSISISEGMQIFNIYQQKIIGFSEYWTQPAIVKKNSTKKK